MKVIGYLLGFGYIAICSCLILYTKKTSDALKGFFQNYQLKYLSVIPAAIGLLFFISASATIYPWVLRIIGLLVIGGAVLTFTDPEKIFSRLLNWYLNVPEQTQRLYGIIGIIFGTVILTWIN
jgi:hypothetical protein